MCELYLSNKNGINYTTKQAVHYIPTFKSNVHFHISIFIILVSIELVLVQFFSVIT